MTLAKLFHLEYLMWFYIFAAFLYRMFLLCFRVEILCLCYVYVLRVGVLCVYVLRVCDCVT